MNTHKHARLTYARRFEMVHQMLEGASAREAAMRHGVTAVTARKWFARYLCQGEDGLADASSRPACSPRTIAPAKTLLIVELRKRRMTQARIASSVGVSESTVSRVLARAGLSKLSDLEPAEPVVRYEQIGRSDRDQNLELRLLTFGFSLLFQEHRSKFQVNYLKDLHTGALKDVLRAQYQVEF